MITSRPPTAVTTDLPFVPAPASAVRIASATMPGSMISPSTIASASSGAIATFTSSGSLRLWSTTATLMRPDPMSRPIVVFFLPKSAMVNAALVEAKTHADPRVQANTNTSRHRTLTDQCQAVAVSHTSRGA